MSQIRAVRTRDNTAKGRGHAILAVEGGNLEVSDCRIVLARGSGSRAEHLGSMGWQTSLARIIPDQVEKTETGLVVHVGPAVVQHMERGNYTLTLVIGGHDVGSKAFAWAVAPFRLARGPLDKPLAIPVEDDGSGIVAGVDTVEVAPRDKPPFETPMVEPEPLVTPHTEAAPVDGAGGDRSRLPLVIGAIALLLLAAGGAWMMMSDDAAEPVAPVATVEPVVEPSPAADPDGESQAEPEVLSPEEEVRRFLATNPNPPEITTKGDDMLARGHAGLALTLYRRAGDAGETAALMAVARLYDPLDPTSAADMPEKRAQFAYNFYRQALALGDTSAEASIAALKSWALEQSAAGDREATQLLRLISLEN